MERWSVTVRQLEGPAPSPVMRATLREEEPVKHVSPPSSGQSLQPYVTLQCVPSWFLLRMGLCCSPALGKREMCVVLCVHMATY